MVYNNILEAIGNTPVIKLQNIAPKDGADILVKFFQAYLSVSVSVSLYIYICMYLHMYMYTWYTDEILNKRDFAVHAIL